MSPLKKPFMSVTSRYGWKRDVQAILSLCPSYKMFEGRVAASQLCTLVREHVEHWTTADCWARLYDCWSAVDDIESLSVIYQMLESDVAKGVLYFRQSLLLLRYIKNVLITVQANAMCHLLVFSLSSGGIFVGWLYH